jgi:hypothetical protein
MTILNLEHLMNDLKNPDDGAAEERHSASSALEESISLPGSFGAQLQGV